MLPSESADFEGPFIDFIDNLCKRSFERRIFRKWDNSNLLFIFYLGMLCAWTDLSIYMYMDE